MSVDSIAYLVLAAVSAVVILVWRFRLEPRIKTSAARDALQELGMCVAVELRLAVNDLPAGVTLRTATPDVLKNLLKNVLKQVKGTYPQVLADLMHTRSEAQLASLLEHYVQVAYNDLVSEGSSVRMENAFGGLLDGSFFDAIDKRISGHATVTPTAPAASVGIASDVTAVVASAAAPAESRARVSTPLVGTLACMLFLGCSSLSVPVNGAPAAPWQSNVIIDLGIADGLTKTAEIELPASGLTSAQIASYGSGLSLLDSALTIARNHVQGGGSICAFLLDATPIENAINRIASLFSSGDAGASSAIPGIVATIAGQLVQTLESDLPACSDAGAATSPVAVAARIRTTFAASARFAAAAQRH